MHNKLTVTIYGQPYRIGGDVSVNSMQKTAQCVDEMMHKVASNNPRLDMAKLSVMAAMNLASELLEYREKHAEVLQRLNKLQQESTS